MTPPTCRFTPTAFWRGSKTGRPRKAAIRPKSYSTCSAKRSRAQRCRGTATEVCREEAGSSPQRCGPGDDAGDVRARGDVGGVRRRLGIGGIVEGDDDNKDNGEKTDHQDNDTDDPHPHDPPPARHPPPPPPP